MRRWLTVDKISVLSAFRCVLRAELWYHGIVEKKSGMESFGGMELYREMQEILSG